MARLLILLFVLMSISSPARSEPNGTIIHRLIVSKALSENKIGLDPQRRISIYLPPGYDRSVRRYPVILYIPNAKQDWDDAAVKRMMSGREVILVSGDFSLPASLNFYGNNSVVGKWLDYVSAELLPLIDRDYRTIPASRAIVGHFLGGNAAFRLAMMHSDLFCCIYAMHPVGTDTGESAMLTIPDWAEIHRSRGYSELKAPYSAPFVAMAQAHSPNSDAGPWFADFMVGADGRADRRAIARLLRSFHLSDVLPEYAEQLSKLKAIRFDWGRDDVNRSHVYGARKFSLRLKDFGIAHQAEEYNGTGWEHALEPGSRFDRVVLPFLIEHMPKP